MQVERRVEPKCFRHNCGWIGWPVQSDLKVTPGQVLKYGLVSKVLISLLVTMLLEKVVDMEVIIFLHMFLVHVVELLRILRTPSGSLSNRILVAGGGGGAGNNYSGFGWRGGHGGGLVGGKGLDGGNQSNGGAGGTQSTFGLGGLKHYCHQQEVLEGVVIINLQTIMTMLAVEVEDISVEGPAVLPVQEVVVAVGQIHLLSQMLLTPRDTNQATVL